MSENVSLDPATLEWVATAIAAKIATLERALPSLQHGSARLQARAQVAVLRPLGAALLRMAKEQSTPALLVAPDGGRIA